MEKKKLSLVFFTHNDGQKTYILMGKQGPEKKMPGIRNGFGGKCEEGETTRECAIREVAEEVNIELKPEDLMETGKIIDEKMIVDVFVKMCETKFEPPKDSSEFVDVQWFDIEMPELFVPEMLPNNDVVIEKLSQKITELCTHGKITELFVVDETDVENQELKLLKSQIHRK